MISMTKNSIRTVFTCLAILNKNTPKRLQCTVEIQDDNDNTEKIFDNPNEVLLLGKALKHSKETKFDKNPPNVQDEVNESINENIEKVLDNPNDHPQAGQHPTIEKSPGTSQGIRRL